jgi:hypothetical protein
MILVDVKEHDRQVLWQYMLGSPRWKESKQGNHDLRGSDTVVLGVVVNNKMIGLINDYSGRVLLFDTC